MTDLRITVRNTSDEGGTALTPFYFGFHNGGFDLFNVGEAASPGLERLAEDGIFAPNDPSGFTTLADERLEGQADAQGGAVVGVTPAGGPGPIAASTVASNTFDIDGAVNQFVSFGAMILPSNDAFVGTDDAVQLFDSEGNFLGAQATVFEGTDVYDAGTELNTEIDAAFLNQTAPDTGLTEGGTIQLHPGFNGSAGNPVNILGGTTAPGAVVDPVAGDFTRNGGQEQMLEIEVTAVELADGTYDVTVTVTNTAPAGGTFLTPVFFGFQDGSFDLYDRGAAVSAGLESLAEDGATGPLEAEFAAATGTGGVSGVTSGGPIAPQSSATQTINVDPALVGPGYFTWASMVIPSNDAFLASPGNPLSDPIFDANGNFVPLTVARIGSDVLDAGTEVNNEQDAAFLNQTAPNTGVDQGGVVTGHQGFNGSEGSPVNILGGTNAFGQEITEEADFTLPGAQIAEVHINTVVTIDGTSGRDLIRGGADDDIIDTGAGRDAIFSGDGYDVIDAGADRDIVRSGAGDDVVLAGAGNDIVLGGDGRDTIDGGSGRDKLLGGDDADVISGEEGRDALFGGDGDDALSGGDDRDALFGGSDDDLLDGGAARDVIFGGSGDDVVIGGTGNDRLFGGEGADHFVFAAGDGRDFIADFEAGVDQIVLVGSSFASAQEVIDAGRDLGGNLRLDLGGGDTVQFRGVSGDDLSDSDFIFV